MPDLTKFQCGHCLHALGLPAKLVGRKIRCPMCGEALEIPPPDPGRRFRRQELGVALERFAISDWDRAFARHVFERKLVPEKALLKAVIALVKAAKKGADEGLGAELQRLDLLDRQACDRVRANLRSTVDIAKSKFVECPNCFANISTKARSCKFCGQTMGDVAIAICPNCKHEQASSLRRCSRCMADMKTGLRTGVRICHGCNRPVIGDPESCPHCKARLREPTRRRSSRSRLAGMRLKLGLVAATLLLLLGALLWRPIGFLLRCARVGAPQARLENRVEDFCSALRRNALDDLAGMVLPGSAGAIDQATRSRIILGAGSDKLVARVLRLRVTAVELAEDGKSARVVVNAKLKLLDQAADLAGSNPFAGSKSTRLLSWRWRRRAGHWYYAATDP